MDVVIPWGARLDEGGAGRWSGLDEYLQTGQRESSFPHFLKQAQLRWRIQGERVRSLDFC